HRTGASMRLFEMRLSLCCHTTALVCCGLGGFDPAVECRLVCLDPLVGLTLQIGGLAFALIHLCVLGEDVFERNAHFLEQVPGSRVRVEEGIVGDDLDVVGRPAHLAGIVGASLDVGNGGVCLHILLIVRQV